MTRKRRRQQPPRVLRWLAPCPDCCATFDAERLLRHEDSCPLADALEDVCAADRDYFRSHPQESERVRPITRAELATLEHLEPTVAAARPAHVHVGNHLPLGCTRTFFTDGERHLLVFDAA